MCYIGNIINKRYLINKKIKQIIPNEYEVYN